MVIHGTYRGKRMYPDRRTRGSTWVEKDLAMLFFELYRRGAKTGRATSSMSHVKRTSPPGIQAMLGGDICVEELSRPDG
jgi:hypothetical protein